MNKDIQYLIQTLEKAIQLNKIIYFYYEGLPRIIEPYHYGILNNNPQIYGYQIGGETHNGRIPQWRNYKIYKISAISFIEGKYFAPRNDYNPKNSKYKTICKHVSVRKTTTA